MSLLKKILENDRVRAAIVAEARERLRTMIDELPDETILQAYESSQDSSLIELLYAVPEGNDILDMSIEDLDLSTRVYNRLKDQEILTIRQILKNPTSFYLKIRGFGKKQLVELEDMLSEYGLALYSN